MTEGSRGLLSVEGRLRRERMLGELTDAMHRHHRTRRARRRAASAACGLLVVAAAAVAARGLMLVPTVESPEAVVPACDIRIVLTDPTILERYRAVPTSRIAEVIDDASLLDELHRLNRRTGLVRVGKQVRLTASVVDEPSGSS